MITKVNRAQRRHNRVRSQVKGTAKIPRLSVAITNKHVVAQLIDDESGKSLVYSSSMGEKLEPTLSVRAAWVGSDVAKKAIKAKMKKVVFDRGDRRYHGRVKALAEAARKDGLEF